jgi:formiminoglutamase
MNLSQHLEPAAIYHFANGHDPHEFKLGATVRRVTRAEHLKGIQTAIIGFPVDEGVRRNHGRTGAAQGPAEIRKCLYRLNARDAFRRAIPMDAVADIGDVRAGKDLEESQERLGEVVAELLRANVRVIVLGGGHETAFGHLLGHIALPGEFAVFNVDPHLDVRESEENRSTSGTPFRQALLRAGERMRYVCLGARATANAPAYADFMMARGGSIHWEEPGHPFPAAQALRSELGAESRERAVVSLDVDAVRSADAPGSSAATPIGITAGEFLQCAMLAGADARVRSFEISECSPPLDRDGQTARLCALAVQAFLFASFAG